MTDPFRCSLPDPLHKDEYSLLRHGIFDDTDVAVKVNADRSFAYLDPLPSMDYRSYVPRMKKLGLQAYKDPNSVVRRRFAKVGDLLPAGGTVVEIGAADATFLVVAQEHRPDLTYIAVEPDRNTLEARSKLIWLRSFETLDQAAAAGLQADFVCLFHVFEHIALPRAFLGAVSKLLTKTGRLLIEVPSLQDPLLSIYGLPAYEAFYFQRQHPFVYTNRSLSRVLEAHGFRVLETIAHQRYGLENHLSWLRHNRPGGDAVLADLVSTMESQYRQALESRGQTDTVFALAEVRT